MKLPSSSFPAMTKKKVAQQPEVVAADVAVLVDASQSEEPAQASVPVLEVDVVAPASEELASEASRVKTVEELMQKREELAPCAAVLEPMEGTGDSFELWESGSAKDETEKTPLEC